MAEPRNLKIYASGSNWIKMSSILSLRLAGYQPLLPVGSTVSITSTEPGISCFDSVERIANGEFDIAISTPIWLGALAAQGLPPYTQPWKISSLACFPHDDRLLFAVRKETGIRTFQDIKDKRYPLRISTPPRETRHPASWGAECVLEEYGFSFEDIEAWGGEVLRDRPRDISKPSTQKSVDPNFDAIFDEAIMTHRWRVATQEYDLNFLSIDEPVIQSLEAKGWRRGILPKGHFHGLEEDVVCMDFSGWYMFCRPDLDDEAAYLTIQAIDEQKHIIENSYTPSEGLSGKVDLSKMCQNLSVPLHPGAEQYYREKGYL